MKNRKPFAISAFIVIGIFGFIFISPSKNFVPEVSNKVLKKALKKEPLNKATRTISSLPKNTKKKVLERKVVGSNKTMSEINITNKVSKDWKEKYTKQFQRMAAIKDLKDFNVELKRSIVKVSANTGTNFEHILVSYIKPNGQPFSFEALVNSETGTMVRTWNKTRYEFKKNYKIEASKYLYKKEKTATP